MSDATVHIAAWEAAGIIDREIADRLRAAVPAPGLEPARNPNPRSAAAELFGPSPTIAEVFGYLGGGFLLGAWSFFLGRSSSEVGGVIPGLLTLVSAGVIAVVGLVLRLRGARGSRAAGVVFFVATACAAVGTVLLLSVGQSSGIISVVLASAAGLVAAAVLRRLHPAVLTQAAILTWITVLAQSLLLLVDERLFGIGFGTGEAGTNPLVLVMAAAAFWLVIAIAIALMGLAEARAGDRTGSRAAHRRAALSRFWAGMTAILGVATAVTRSASMPDGSYGRVLEPIVGEAVLVLISVVLIERAFRRGATSFMYAAALGLILALTDFNVSYLSDTTEVALLVEGLVLLGVGVAANRLRKRIGVADEPAAPDGTAPDGTAPDAAPFDATAPAVGS